MHVSMTVSPFLFCKQVHSYYFVIITHCLHSFYLFIYFHWRLITLQYCGGCSHTLTENGCTCIPFSWTPPPQFTGFSQSTSFECPASCIELALVICFTYGNMHVSMLFSHIIPLLLLPHSPKVCSLHLCLFCCLPYRVAVTIFLNSKYML